MLIEFKVKNYRSFKDEQVLSMVASSHSELSENEFTRIEGLPLLTTAAIYGANASGKSNLLCAIADMRAWVLGSFDNQVKLPVIKPFLLNQRTATEPTLFEISFTETNRNNTDVFRYGFEISGKIIESEALYLNESPVFKRTGQTFDVDKRRIKDSEIRQHVTRRNALFISVLNAMNSTIGSRVIGYFEKQLRVTSGLLNQASVETKAMIGQQKYADEINKFLKSADFSIQRLSLVKHELGIKNMAATDELPTEILADLLSQSRQIRTQHNVYDDEGQVVGQVRFSASDAESAGTREIISILGPIIKILQSGGTLLIDEMDALLHPFMTNFIISLFGKGNKQGAQLIFNTQNTMSMNNRLLRRDQIWFAEKDNVEATHLTSLINYRHNGQTVRSDVNYSKNYLAGKYGAVPIIEER